MSGERDRAGSVSRRNGAWLIAVNGELSEYATPDEQYDCASNLRVAKKLATDIAATFGYLPPFRWINSQQGLHELIATRPDEEAEEA